jgi:hypothetical protein
MRWVDVWSYLTDHRKEDVSLYHAKESLPAVTYYWHHHLQSRKKGRRPPGAVVNPVLPTPSRQPIIWIKYGNYYKGRKGGLTKVITSARRSKGFMGLLRLCRGSCLIVIHEIGCRWLLWCCGNRDPRFLNLVLQCATRPAYIHIKPLVQ